MAVEQDIVGIEQQVLQQQQGVDEPLKLSRCSFTQDELHKFDDVWLAPEFSLAAVQAQGANDAVVKPLPDEEIAALSVMHVGQVPEVGTSPPWARQLAHHRDYFQQCLLRLTYPDGDEEHVKVLFALQNPIIVGFVGVLVEEECSRDPDEPLAGDHASWEHNFVVQEQSFVFSDSDKYKEVSQVEVLDSMVWLGSVILVSDADWRQLDTVLQLLPPLARGKGESSAPQKAPASRPAELLEQFPWLADLGGHRKAAAVPGRQKHTLASRGGCSGVHEEEQQEEEKKLEEEEDSEDEELDIDGLQLDEESDDEAEQRSTVELDEQASLSFAAKQDEMHKQGAKGEGPFAWRVCGGSWTKAHLGVDYDAFRAEVRSQAALPFISEFGLQKSASFSLAVYGELVAKTLAEYWTDKMTFYYNAWVEAGRQNRVFSDADISTWEDPAEFTAVLNSSSGKVLSRMRALQKLKPGVPSE